MRKSDLIAALCLGGLIAACGDSATAFDANSEAAAQAAEKPAATPQPKPAGDGRGGKGKMIEKVVKSDEEWKKLLTREQYHVTREKGTERAFTGEYWNNHEKGIYRCVACGLELFDSDTKFESGTGWPSFWAPVDEAHVENRSDWTFGMKRTEVVCARCGSHLGHVFDDGPEPTGLRYCMNSAALKLEKRP